MVGQVVVVFDGFKGGGFTEEAEVMNWNGGGEEGLEGCTLVLSWEVKREGGGEGRVYRRPFLDRNAGWERGRWSRVRFWWWCIRILDGSCSV